MRSGKELSGEIIKKEGKAAVSSLHFILSMRVRYCLNFFSKHTVCWEEVKSDSYELSKSALVRVSDSGGLARAMQPTFST